MVSRRWLRLLRTAEDLSCGKMCVYSKLLILGIFFKSKVHKSFSRDMEMIQCPRFLQYLGIFPCIVYRLNNQA